MTFIVVMQGVYVQNVFGPLTLGEAKEFAKGRAMADKDSYHTWDVYMLDHEGLSRKPLYSTKKGAEDAS